MSTHKCPVCRASAKIPAYLDDPKHMRMKTHQKALGRDVAPSKTKPILRDSNEIIKRIAALENQNKMIFQKLGR